MIRVNCTYFVFWETCKYLCSLLSAVPNEKNMIFKQNEKNVHNIILFKSLHPRLLMHCVAFLSISTFPPFVIAVYESLSCPQCENMDLKIIVTVGKGSNMQKMLENQRMCRSWRIILKNSRQMNCSGPVRDS